LGSSGGWADDKGGEEDQQQGDQGALKPAWEDDDDAKVTVNIANKNRLRKLRETQDEDEIAGDEYEKRLRSR